MGVSAGLGAISEYPPMTRANPRRWWLRLGAVALSLVMVVTLAELPAFAEEEEWEPPAPPEVDSVEVAEIGAAARSVFGAEHAVVSGDDEVLWPEPGLARVRLPAGSAARRGVAGPGEAPQPGLAGRVPAGDLPVRIGAAPLTPQQAQAWDAGVTDAIPPAPAEVSVMVADRQAAQHAGVGGVVGGVARGDGRQEAGSVAVEVDYSGFRHAYGGDWASRLRLVAFGRCEEDSFGLGRSRTGCGAPIPLPSSNDLKSGVLTAAVPLAADGGYTMFAVTGGESGDNGDYSATSLEPAGTWQVSQQTGAFSWNHPLRVVPGLGGPEPSLALSYSSQAVDGRTTNTNTQGSWIGDGWDLWPGYIERSYQSCSQDTDRVSGQDPNNKDNETGDQCWVSDNASMSLNGRATELVKDGANRFRGVDDDGSRIERLTDTSLGNGTHNGEYWRVTTVDGTQYYFGRHRRQGHPTDTVATNSTWTVPVYGNHPSEPCYRANDFAGSRCTQGWRWNLDYVVDPHGNTMTLFYSRETGAYGREGDKDKRTTYHRGGHLSRIEYGTRSGSEHQSQAPFRVMFDVADRCKPNSTCNPSTPSAWPDTPWDQYCDSTPCTDQQAPTFWTQKRLERVRAQVLRGSSYSTVESWELEHQWLDAGDSDGEAIPMWLKGITRVGHVTTAGGQQTTDPQVVFDPGADPLPNRVKGAQDGFSAMNRWRLRGIFTESGSYVGIGYSKSDCSASNPPTPHTNKKRCYPQWYAPSEGYFESEIHWFHKYVVTMVSVHDTTGVSPTQETHYDYLDDPAWAYTDSELVPKDKRTWAQWRGYSEVRVRQGVEGEPQLATEYRYLRGMHGDRAGPGGGTRSVSVTDSQGRSVTDHEAHAGFLLEETVRNGPNGAWVSGTINTPWRHGPTATSGPLKAYLTNTREVRTRNNLGGGNVRWTRTVTDFDTTFGMPTQVDERGDESTTSDDLCIRYEYARNTSSGMVDRLSRTETVSVQCGQNPSRPGHVVSDERTFYDNPDTYRATPSRGLPVKTQEVGSWSGSTPQWVTTATTSYDAHGRVRQSADALGRTVTTAYTPATGGPVTQLRETNPAGHRTTETWEPAWQLPVRIVDANDQVTELTYDGTGRLTAVWLPGRPRAELPNLRFSYLLRNHAPSAVTTENLLPSGTGYVKSVLLYDGTLRERQTQTQAPGGGRIIVDTVHDSRGLLEWESEGYYNSQNPSAAVVGTAGQPQIPSLTSYIYDGAGRVAHEIFRINGQEAWRTSYGYAGDRTHLTPPAGGTATTTITDARDRVTALRQYHGPTPSGPYDEITYSYTPRGDVKTVVDPAGNQWSYEYDQRGREVLTVDPDKGAVASTYDAVGQPSAVTDARGATLGFTYDALGRRTSVRDNSPTGPLRAEWVYDTLTHGVGKLTRSIRHHDGAQYVVEVTGYTPAGQPTGNRVIVPGAEDGLAGSYTTETTYRVDGSPATMTLPAAGELPQERLVFSYDDVGAPTGMTSPWGLYTYSVTYDKLGNLSQRVLGPHGKRVAVTYLYDEATGRLMNTSAVPELQPEIMDLAYSYSDVGNITRIADSPGSDTPIDTQCFGYDYLQRLTDAWTPAAAGPNNCAASPSVGALGGAAPYWHSYTFDRTGNRLSETQRAPGVGTEVTTYTYPAAGAVRPHALLGAERNGPGGAQHSTFEYDQTGNLVTRAVGGVNQSLTWDAEGFLTSVDDGEEATEFIYDADGERLIRRDEDGSTLYLSGGQEVRYNSSTGSIGCTRYYQHLGTVIAVRTPSSLTWMISDHHGTAELAVAADDLTPARKRITPYGGQRGAAPAFWVGDKGFVGGTEDPTGLTHLGARLYDPQFGRFISVDPLIDVFHPQQMHGYAYSNNSPPSFVDSDGLFLRKAFQAAVTNNPVAQGGLRALSSAGQAVKSGFQAAGNAIAESPIGKHLGTISTVASVVALACTFGPPPLQVVGAIAGGVALAAGALDTVAQCGGPGSGVDCGVAVAGMIPGGKAAKAVTTFRKGRQTSENILAARQEVDLKRTIAKSNSNDSYLSEASRARYATESHKLAGTSAVLDFRYRFSLDLNMLKLRQRAPMAVADLGFMAEKLAYYGAGVSSGSCQWHGACSYGGPRYSTPAPPRPQAPRQGPAPSKPSPSSPAPGSRYRPSGGSSGGHYIV